MTVRTVLVGPRFRVERHDLTGRDGAVVERDLVVHPGAAVVAAYLDDGRLLFVENTRPMLGRTLLELPAGTRADDEPPEHTAARELEEETGYRAARLVHRLSFFASPGITDERMHVFEADGLTYVGQRLDPTEALRVVALHPEEALAACRDGRIEDGKTLAVLLHLHAFGRTDAPVLHRAP